MPRIARKLEVQISGTLGVLFGCTQKNLLSLDQANRLLAEMIAFGYHSPISDINLLSRSPR